MLRDSEVPGLYFQDIPVQSLAEFAFVLFFFWGGGGEYGHTMTYITDACEIL